MKNYKRTKPTSIVIDLETTDNDDVLVDIYHEFGDVVLEDLEVTGTNPYTLTLDTGDLESAGVHKLVWNYEVDGDPKSTTSYINVYTPYITGTEFFGRHEELEDEWSDRFDEIEIKVRNVINTFCGQDFDIRYGKTLVLDGDGSRSLHLPMRLETLSEAAVSDPITSGSESTDITELVQISPESHFYLRLRNPKSIYGSTSEVTINGDWGWPYIPQNVTDAADIIIEDWFNDDSAYRKHGVQEVDIDRHRMKFNEAIFGSTGNIDADILLMDYMLMVFDLI
jgi:hypothetical protein